MTDTLQLNIKDYEIALVYEVELYDFMQTREYLLLFKMMDTSIAILDKSILVDYMDSANSFNQVGNTTSPILKNIEKEEYYFSNPLIYGYRPERKVVTLFNWREHPEFDEKPELVEIYKKEKMQDIITELKIASVKEIEKLPRYKHPDEIRYSIRRA